MRLTRFDAQKMRSRRKAVAVIENLPAARSRVPRIDGDELFIAIDINIGLAAGRFRRCR